MLNRLFIVVGVLAIFALAAGFIAPLFVDWSGYRERMEAMGAEVMGTDVVINGDIDVTLLPQPKLRFADVVVGPPDLPLAEIARVEAEFSLMDFLRDQYAVTRLVLSGPRITLRIDEAGHFAAPVHLAESVSASNVSVEDADIVDGSLFVLDARTATILSASDFDGNLQMAGLRGPFSLQGTVMYEGQGYETRLNTSAMNAEDVLQATVFVRPSDGGGSLSMEGVLSTRTYPTFNGTATFRQSPVASSDANAVRGDLVFSSDIEANASQILFSNYSVAPDENRPATRLTGAAVVTLGADPGFDAVISGGVVALNPRDALVEETARPYELVRLLAELPAPFMPQMPGRIGIDISELDVRAFALRDLRIDARSDGAEWSIETMSARLPGNSDFSLAGSLSAAEGRPVFDGTVRLDAARLDALAQQWRRPADNNPLFNMPGSLSARVKLADDTLFLTNGRFVLDDSPHVFSLTALVGDAPQLDIAAQFGVLDGLQSRALQALLPDVNGDPDFGLTFPVGSFDLSAERMQMFDLTAFETVARGGWDAGVVTFDRLAVADFGGARLDVSGLATGTVLAPRLAVQGQVSLGDGAATDVLPLVFDAVNAPDQVRNLASAIVPAELSIVLTGPGESDGQDLTLRGRIGVAEIDMNAGFSGGLWKVSQSPLDVDIQLNSGQPVAFTEQFGFGAVPLVPEGEPISVSLIADGTPSNSIDVDLSVLGGDDSSRFTGNLIVGDLSALRGRGSLDFAVSDVTPFGQIMGVEGIGFGAASGRADVSFNGDETLAISNIDVAVGNALISGEINRSLEADDYLFAGALRVSALEVYAMAGLLGGPSSLISTTEVWPDGPFGFSERGRSSRGRLSVETPFVRHAGRDLATEAQFDLVWDATNTRIRGFEAGFGGGQIGFELGVCCAGVDAERQVTGRFSLADVEMDALLPSVPASVLGGSVSGGVSVTGSGVDYTDIISQLGGEGSFAIEGFTIDGFDPAAFERVAATDNILELEPDELTVIVRDALAEGGFVAPNVGGAFSLAGGAMRLNNIAAEGEQARLFGDMNMQLDTLALEGDWTLTPTAIDDPNGLVSAITAQITALISGNLAQPGYQLDLGPMIDAIKVRAFEIEVDRLEAQRAIEEERARVAAEERALLMEQQAQERAAEELARAEAAAERARDEEAQRILDQIEEELGASQDPLLTNPNGLEGPIDLVPDTPFVFREPIFENDPNSF